MVGGGARRGGGGGGCEVVDGPSLMAMRPLDGSDMAGFVVVKGGKSYVMGDFWVVANICTECEVGQDGWIGKNCRFAGPH